MGIEVEARDINREPPPREFLERHIPDDGFLDFISRRSPVWKERPLPKSKQEAIALMLERPSLMKRPVLVAGRKVLFGFDEDNWRQALE